MAEEETDSSVSEAAIEELGELDRLTFNVGGEAASEVTSVVVCEELESRRVA